MTKFDNYIIHITWYLKMKLTQLYAMELLTYCTLDFLAFGIYAI